MTIIYSFITSDSAALLQFLLLLGVIAVFMLIGIQIGNRLRTADHENRQLKRDVGNLYEQVDRSNARLQNQLGRHEELLCKLGMHVTAGEPMTEEDFDSVGHARVEAIVPDIVVDLAAYSDRHDHRDLMPLPTDSFEEYDQDDNAADSSVHGRSVVSYIDNRQASESRPFGREDHSVLDGGAESDLLTRALRLSKASGE